MIWEYNNSTNIIWTSFDYGEVQADTKEEALLKAKAELVYNLKKANDALSLSQNTENFTIEMNLDQIEVTLKE